jgi:hypothetical protein
MAQTLRDRGVDGCVIAVDTWLGSADHWVEEKWWLELGFQFGYPSIQRKFMTNVIDAGMQDYIVPLPLDSINASSVIYNFGIRPDVIHIDGGHEYASVKSDLNAWWSLIRPGGLLIGDDYYESGGWAGVKQAIDEFCAENNVRLEATGGKCRVRKPA